MARVLGSHALTAARRSSGEGEAATAPAPNRSTTRATQLPGVVTTGAPADIASRVTPLTRSANSRGSYGCKQIAPSKSPR